MKNFINTALIISFAFSLPVLAETTIPRGNVSGEWDLAGSPYIIEGDINIPSGESLTIQPGVEVFFDSWYQFSVNGVLNAVGTEEQMISFTSEPAGPGEPGWLGIRFVDSDEGSVISYASITNGKATAGDPFDRGAALYIDNSNPEISHSVIADNQASHYGAGIYIYNASPSIINNDITNNLTGYATYTYGGGIYAIDSAPEIIGNVFSGNSAVASGYTSASNAGGGAIWLNNSDAIVKDNIFWGNIVDANGNVGTKARGGAIGVTQASPVIDGNTFYENEARYYSFVSHGGGIYLTLSNAIITNNIISENLYGGIYFDQFALPTVEYNEFYRNSEGNFLGEYTPTQLGVISMTNNNGDPADNYYNIYLDPMFVDAVHGNFNLLPNSPAIDAGSPAVPLDPDNTAADLGALYFDQNMTMNLSVSLVPESTPILINAGGGSFEFSLSIENVDPAPVTFDAWIEVMLPDGRTYGPVAVQQDLNLEGGAVLEYNNVNQNVPQNAPTGEYTYYLRTGYYPGYVAASDEFTFEKTLSPDGIVNSEGWNVEGLEEDLELSALSTPADFSLLTAYPNPFNPTTNLKFELGNAANVTLAVFDIQGREVARLVSGFQSAGQHVVSFDAVNFASGVYFARLTGANINQTQKLMLLK